MLTRALFTAAVLFSAAANAGDVNTAPRTSSGSAPNSSPDIDEVVTKTCPAGKSMVGITIDNVRGKSTVMRARCRPTPPAASGSAWCDPTPPDGVECDCDGFEKLRWEQNGNNGCWMCVGTGEKCPTPASCQTCVGGASGTGAWFSQGCVSHMSVTYEGDLARLSADRDSCAKVTTTSCTYQAYPNARCN